MAGNCLFFLLFLLLLTGSAGSPGVEQGEGKEKEEEQEPSLQPGTPQEWDEGAVSPSEAPKNGSWGNDLWKIQRNDLVFL